MPYSSNPSQLNQIIPSIPAIAKLPYNHSFTLEDHRNALMAALTKPSIKEKKIEALLQKDLPGFAFGSIDRNKQQRAARKALSLNAQTQVIDLALRQKRYDVSVQQGGVPALPSGMMYRPWSAFLRYSDNPADIAFNQQLVALYNQGDPVAAGNFLFAEIEKSRKEANINTLNDLQAVWELDDSQLVERFPSLYRYLQLIGEFETIEKNEKIKFSDQQKAQLLPYKNTGMDLTLTLNSRMSTIANPFYEIMDPGYLRSVDTEHLLTNLTSYEDPGNHYLLQDYISQIYTANTQRAVGAMDRLTQNNPYLIDASLGVPDRAQKSTANALSSYLPVVAHTQHHGTKVLLAGQPEKVLDNTAYMASLSDLTVKADKWLLSGSREFSKMQKALTHLKQYATKHPDATAEDMQKETDAVVKAARSYLKHKDIRSPYGLAQTNGKGKNLREQSRMDVASAILSFAQAQNNALAASISKQNEPVAQNKPQVQSAAVSSQNQIQNQPQNETELQVAQARSRLNDYMSGTITGGTQVNINNRSVRYIQHIAKDVATLAFQEAVTLSNQAEPDGKGAYQQIIDHSGYQTAFNEFWRLLNQSGTIARSGLVSTQKDSVANFLKDNGPKKIAQAALKLDPQQMANQKKKPSQHQDLSHAMVIKKDDLPHK